MEVGSAERPSLKKGVCSFHDGKHQDLLWGLLEDCLNWAISRIAVLH